MNPHISLPQRSGPSTFGSTLPTSTYSSNRNDRQTGPLRMPRFFKRLFKFPQMDFELAVWEMTHLIIAPKKVFRNMFYHNLPQKQTKNTYHRADPSFTYLLSLFLLLTSLAWGLAYADGFPQTVRLTLVFVFGHFVGLSLLVSAAAYFLVGRLLGPMGGMMQ
ncbi:hypothetical protein LTS18_012640, partial [Coniosporium uncinatum]